MKDLPLSRIMSRPLVSVAPDESLHAAAELMKVRHIHHLVVLDNGRMAGILSSADLLKLALLVHPDPEDGPPTLGDSIGIRVRDIMQSHVAVVRENASLGDVARALSLGGFHAIPVLAIDGTPIGIVTSSDLLELLVNQIDLHSGSTESPAPKELPDAVTPSLLEVLSAAEVYLHSGQSDQQHSRLTRAVARARELAPPKGVSLRL